MRNILMFIDWYRPGYKAGGPVRSCTNMVDHLRDDFCFYIITSSTDYCDETPYQSVKSNDWNAIGKNEHVWYAEREKLNIKTIKNIIREISFDVVYINGIYSWYFSIIPLYLFKNKVKKIVVAPRGMLSSHALSVKSLKKHFFIKLVNTIHHFRHITFHSTFEQEKSDILNLIAKHGDLHLIPNFPKYTSEENFLKKKKQPGNCQLISIARISPEKNTLYALQVLKHINRHIVDFHIYGSVYDKTYWKKCKDVIDQIPENVSVYIHGSIHPDEIEQKYQSAHFLFLPTTGENFGHSIYEALAAGCPVIISDNTPWKNLEQNKAGWDIPLNQKETFIKIIEKCTDLKQDEYDTLSDHAREYAKSMIDTKHIKKQYIALFTE